MKERLYAGIARQDITPKIGARLFGYLPDSYSESTNDNLTLTAFVFKEKETKALMISISACLLKTKLANELRNEISASYGIDYNNIIISTTHTHTGPCIAEMKGWGDVDYEYYNDILKPALFKSVDDADKNLQPVTVSVASGKSKVGINRRQLKLNNIIELGQCEWGTYNPEMTVITFKNETNEIIGNIIHYGCHGTAAGNITVISRDWMGIMTDALEKETGAITAFFNGPEGDVGPRLSNGGTTGHDIKYVYELGEFAARDAIRIFKKQCNYKEVNLLVKTKEIQLPLKPRIPYDEAVKGIESFNGNKANIDFKIYEYNKAVKESYDNGYEERSFKKVEQTVIKIGEVIFVSFPYELFSEIGMRINEAVKGLRVLSLSNANGNEGYFPTQDQLCRGGYEIGMFKHSDIQCFADDADFHIVKETLRNMEEFTHE